MLSRGPCLRRSPQVGAQSGAKMLRAGAPKVFSVFHSTNPGEVGPIRGWYQWMESIVEQLADQEVRHRWLRLRRECGD